MRKIVLDTNVIVDYLLGREPTSAECTQLLLMHAACEHAVYVSPLSLKDAYYLVNMHLKRMERQASGHLADSMARAANEVAWSCVRALADNVLILPVGRAETLQAIACKSVHSDFEDNLVIAAALSANADFVVTNDAALLRHAPIACLSTTDTLTFLQST